MKKVEEKRKKEAEGVDFLNGYKDPSAAGQAEYARRKRQAAKREQAADAARKQERLAAAEKKEVQVVDEKKDANKDSQHEILLTKTIAKKNTIERMGISLPQFPRTPPAACQFSKTSPCIKLSGS